MGGPDIYFYISQNINVSIFQKQTESLRHLPLVNFWSYVETRMPIFGPIYM